MADWLIHVLTSAGTVGAAIWLIQKYIISRIGHDFAKKLEKLKPLTAEETLRRENFLNAKRDAYYEVTKIAVQELASQKVWLGEGVPSHRNVESKSPTEFEINSAMGKIALFSDTSEISQLFLKIFKGPSPADLGLLLSAMRSDLGYGYASIAPEVYPYIFGGETPEQKLQNARNSVRAT